MRFYSEGLEKFISKHYIVLRYLEDKGLKTQRVISKDLGIALGTVSSSIFKLKREGLLQPGKSVTPPNDEGKLLLHELWPEKYPLPKAFENVQDEDAPF